MVWFSRHQGRSCATSCTNSACTNLYPLTHATAGEVPAGGGYGSYHHPVNRPEGKVHGYGGHGRHRCGNDASALCGQPSRARICAAVQVAHNVKSNCGHTPGFFQPDDPQVSALTQRSFRKPSKHDPLQMSEYTYGSHGRGACEQQGTDGPVPDVRTLCSMSNYLLELLLQHA